MMLHSDVVVSFTGNDIEDIIHNFQLSLRMNTLPKSQEKANETTATQIKKKSWDSTHRNRGKYDREGKS